MKPLLEAFPTLQLKGEMRNLFENTHVERISAPKDRSILRVYLGSDHLIEKDKVWALESEMKKSMFPCAETDVKIYERFHLSALYTLETLMEAYGKSILQELKEASPLECALFQHAEISYPDGQTVKVVLEDSFLAREKERELVRILEKILQERCGISARVEADFREKEEREDKMVQERRLESLVAEIASRSREHAQSESVSGEEGNEAAGDVSPKAESSPKMPQGRGGKQGKDARRPPRRSGNPDVVFGRDFEGDAVPIENIIDEIGEVVIRGKVLSFDEKAIEKIEKTIMMFSVTDFTDTIGVKIFVKTEQADEVRPALQKGNFLKIKGIAAMDKFDHELGISSVAGIKKISDFTVKRMDESAVKRVELHCHTKMSDMDGVSDVQDIVKRAYQWGMPAIAITDHGVVHSFPDANHAWEDLWKEEKEKRKAAGETEPDKFDFFKVIYGMEGYLVDDLTLLTDDGTGHGASDEEGSPSLEAVKKLTTYHVIILAKNNVGRTNLYTLVSKSHLDYYSKRPRIPKSELAKYREGLIIGSACEAGELYRALLDGRDEEELARIASFYDYLEIQPLANNEFMVESEKRENIHSIEDIKDLNRKVVELGETLGKPVVATCDVHFLDPEDELYRRIIMAARKYENADNQSPLYLRTTEEMLEEFQYLGSEKAKEIVITNTNLIADMVDTMSPVRPDKCPPIIADSDKTLRDICYAKAHELYGEKLPKIVETRMNKELDSIIGNGFAVMYIIAQKLVWKSVEDGYLVGSRGSVGSSFAAFLAGITEVNSLRPHYRCPHCFYCDFDSEEVKAFAGGSGCDMPDKACPNCGEKLVKDGFDIPFETFLGFKGDKEPDIDLNFSGEYQSRAHKYTEVIFGRGQTYRAGTIATMADKTAYGYVKHYYEDRQLHKRDGEIKRIARGCTGIRRSTSQHPGGIIVLPVGEDINSFTPVQHPANEMTTDIVTTHFDYHSIDHNLLKLDILGHDDPTMIRMLQDLTGLDPTKIPLDDAKVMSLFTSTDALGVTPDDIGGCPVGSLGIPEFGTDFVIQTLLDTKPQRFSDLVRISGLGHGENVWLGNAKTLIEEGKATISTAICCRDDIMIYLIQMGLEPALAFQIMESVRKGKGLKPDWEAAMTKEGVPDWYLWSCNTIKYMFPKAHAVAYVMMAWRIAYCKVYYPLAYYAAFFSIRASAFSYEMMCKGRERLESTLNEYKRRGKKELTDKEQDAMRDMKIVQEMYARGFEFLPIDLYGSDAKLFRIVDGKLLPPFLCIDGLGEKAADSICEAAKLGPFLSKEDLRERAKVGQVLADQLGELGILGDIPESNQISLFDFMS